MGKSGNNFVDAEWERVMRNPENMLVSDSLKDRVASIMSNKPSAPGFSADLLVGSHKLSLDLTRLEKSKDRLAISGTCDKFAVKPVLSAGLEEWTKALVLCGDEILFEVPLSERQIEVFHDFLSSESECFVTVVALVPTTKSMKRVL